MSRDWRALARRCAGPAVGLVVVVGIFVAVIPRFADYQAVWQAMINLTGRDWAVIAVCTVMNVASGGLPWMAGVPGLGYRRSMLLTQTSGLMTTVLPMGEAVGFATQVAMLRRWRFPHRGRDGRLRGRDRLEPGGEHRDPESSRSPLSARATRARRCSRSA